MTFELVMATAYLTCGALMLFLGFVILRENPRQLLNRTTAAMLVFGGLGPILGAYAKLGVSENVTNPLFQDVFARFAFLWEFFFPATLLFALVFPTVHPLLRRFPRLIPLLFLPHAMHVGFALAVGETDSAVARLSAGSLAYFGQTTNLLRVITDLALKAHVRFFSLVNLAMIIVSWVLLTLRARRTQQPKLRAQIRTIVSWLGFGLGLYAGAELIPRAFGMNYNRSITLPLVTVSLLVSVVGIVVAIVRMGFLDVRFIVRRGLVYGLVSGAIVAMYLFVGKQIDKFSGTLTGQEIPFFETTFLVLSLFLLQPVLSEVERRVDRGYSRDRSDLRNALARLGDQVVLMLNPEEVARAVAETMRRELVLSSAAVVTRDRDTSRFETSTARDGKVSTAPAPFGGPLFEALGQRRDRVQVAEIVEAPEADADRVRLGDAMAELGAEVAFPLHARSGEGANTDLVGVLLLGRKVTETPITFEESGLVSLIAGQVGVSLLNGAVHEERVARRLFEEEAATARRIQHQLLPDAPPDLPGWELSASNSPSRQVGGDYHDFLPMPDQRIGIAIGDVSGKGVPAALLMSNLQAALRVRAPGGHDIDRVVQDVNRQICRNTGQEIFISFFLAELDPECGRLLFVNAGHNAPVLLRSDGRVELLETGGLLLGVFPDAAYELGEVDMGPGDILAMYTDGVTEAWNDAGDMFSDERLLQSLMLHRAGSVLDLHGGILEDVRTFQAGRPADDDLTLVLLKRLAVVPAAVLS